MFIYFISTLPKRKEREYPIAHLHAKGTIYLESFARDTYAKILQPRLWTIGDVSQDRHYAHHLLVQISHVNDSKDVVIYICRLSDY
jgi:hypothetical protein